MVPPVGSRADGRTNCSKAMIAETGYPGTPTTGLFSDHAQNGRLARHHGYAMDQDVTEFADDR